MRAGQGGVGHVRHVVKDHWYMDCETCGLSLLSIDEADALTEVERHNKERHDG